MQEHSLHLFNEFIMHLLLMYLSWGLQVAQAKFPKFFSICENYFYVSNSCIHLGSCQL